LDSRDAKRERRRHLKHKEEKQIPKVTGLDIIGSSDTRGSLLYREKENGEMFNTGNGLEANFIKYRLG